MISKSRWNRKIIIVKESNTLKALQLATERHRNNATLYGNIEGNSSENP